MTRKALTAEFDGRVVSYPFGELDTLVLAYATTTHKSQGSEYHAVVIPVTTQHYMMLACNRFYTGVTHGKKLVVIVGHKRALAMAVRADGKRRWTKLREWLGSNERPEEDACTACDKMIDKIENCLIMLVHRNKSGATLGKN